MLVDRFHNGDTINDKLSHKKCVISTWVDEEVPAEQAIEQAYLAALSRWPSSEERKRVFSLISAADQSGVSRRESYEDLLWGLMTSREFLFSH